MKGQEREQLSEAGRALAAGRRVVGTIRCAVCGKETTVTTAGAPNRKKMYCSQACGVRAHRQRNREQYNARQRERRAARKEAPPTGGEDQ
jgi:ferredoxin